MSKFYYTSEIRALTISTMNNKKKLKIDIRRTSITKNLDTSCNASCKSV